MKRLLPALMIVLAAAPASAQSGADSWNALRASGAVRIGDKVYVTEADGRKAAGRVSVLSDASLVILTDGLDQRTLAPSGIARIEKNDSVVNGLLFGLGGGLVAAWVAKQSLCGSNDSECEVIVNVVVGAPLVAGGAVAGGITDLLIRKTVYVGRRAGRSRIGLTPILANHRKGLAFSLGF